MNSLLAEGVTESAADAPLDVEISPTTEANTSTARLTARIRWSIETLHGEPLYEDSPIKPSRDKRTQMSTKVAGHGFRITLTAGRSRERCGRQETRSDSPPGTYLSMASARVSSFLPRAVVVPNVRQPRDSSVCASVPDSGRPAPGVACVPLVSGSSAFRFSLLDRRPHEVPPFRPRAVVVPAVRVAEEVLQDEPRVRRPLADRAVGDDFPEEALRFVPTCSTEPRQPTGSLAECRFSDGNGRCR